MSFHCHSTKLPVPVCVATYRQYGLMGYHISCVRFVSLCSILADHGLQTTVSEFFFFCQDVILIRTQKAAHGSTGRGTALNRASFQGQPRQKPPTAACSHCCEVSWTAVDGKASYPSQNQHYISSLHTGALSPPPLGLSKE